VREQFLSAFAIGLVAVAVVVAGIMYMQRGAHMELTGAMTVRVHGTDDNTALALIDLHINNPADYGFELGPFHPTLYTKYVIPAHSTGDYTLLAQYSAPERILNDRKRFVVRIDEINGKAAEFSEK
jgi:hypothetical protein